MVYLEKSSETEFLMELHQGSFRTRCRSPSADGTPDKVVVPAILFPSISFLPRGCNKFELNKIKENKQYRSFHDESYKMTNAKISIAKNNDEH